MTMYEVELVVSNVEIYRVEAVDEQGAYDAVMSGNYTPTETHSMDIYFDKCIEVE